METGKHFHIISCHVLWRELCHYAAQEGNIYTFHFLKQGLHNTPDKLRERLQQAIDQAEADPELEPDAILIGYGLCGYGVQGIRARKTPLVIMRGHDCITFLLGSKEQFKHYFEQNPGTYWYSPGWIELTTMPGKDRYDKLRQQYVAKYGEDNADYLMEMEQGWFNHYSNAAYVDLGTGNTNGHEQYTRQCADWLGWKFDSIKGNPQLVVNFLRGRWNDEDYLIVRPGEMIVPTYDDRIIGVKQAED